MTSRCSAMASYVVAMCRSIFSGWNYPCAGLCAEGPALVSNSASSRRFQRQSPAGGGTGGAEACNAGNEPSAVGMDGKGTDDPKK
jgi:hypothetical protein